MAHESDNPIALPRVRIMVAEPLERLISHTGGNRQGRNRLKFV